MEFQDKVLKCIDCGTDFIFTAGEQLFFHDKPFNIEPKRCKTCKAKRIAVLRGPHGTPGQARYNEVAVQDASPAMAEACPRCGTEFLPGSCFCHTCGQRRPEAISASTRADAAALARLWERGVYCLVWLLAATATFVAGTLLNKSSEDTTERNVPSTDSSSGEPDAPVRAPLKPKPHLRSGAIALPEPEPEESSNVLHTRTQTQKNFASS